MLYMVLFKLYKETLHDVNVVLLLHVCSDIFQRYFLKKIYIDFTFRM